MRERDYRTRWAAVARDMRARFTPLVFETHGAVGSATRSGLSAILRLALDATTLPEGAIRYTFFEGLREMSSMLQRQNARIILEYASRARSFIREDTRTRAQRAADVLRAVTYWPRDHGFRTQPTQPRAAFCDARQCYSW